MTMWRIAVTACVTVFGAYAQDQPLLGRAEISVQLERDLLEAICPGKVSGRSCEKCPAFTSFHSTGGQLRIQNAVRGHFTSPAADEITAAVMGCEPHMLNWGGAALFERQPSGRWKMRWYDADYRRRPPHDCRRFTRIDGRDVLLCSDLFGGQGLYWHSIFAVDLSKRLERESPVFGLEGNSGSHIDNGPRRDTTIIEAQDTEGGIRFRVGWGRKPPLNISPIDVRFDGQAFHLTAESKKELARIEAALR